MSPSPTQQVTALLALSLVAVGAAGTAAATHDAIYWGDSTPARGVEVASVEAPDTVVQGDEIPVEVTFANVAGEEEVVQYAVRLEPGWSDGGALVARGGSVAVSETDAASVDVRFDSGDLPAGQYTVVADPVKDEHRGAETFRVVEEGSGGGQSGDLEPDNAWAVWLPRF